MVCVIFKGMTDNVSEVEQGESAPEKVPASPVPPKQPSLHEELRWIHFDTEALSHPLSDIDREAADRQMRELILEQQVCDDYDELGIDDLRQLARSAVFREQNRTRVLKEVGVRVKRSVSTDVGGALAAELFTRATINPRDSISSFYDVFPSDRTGEVPNEAYLEKVSVGGGEAYFHTLDRLMQEGPDFDMVVQLLKDPYNSLRSIQMAVEHFDTTDTSPIKHKKYSGEEMLKIVMARLMPAVSFLQATALDATTGKILKTEFGLGELVGVENFNKVDDLIRKIIFAEDFVLNLNTVYGDELKPENAALFSHGSASAFVPVGQYEADRTQAFMIAQAIPVEEAALLAQKTEMLDVGIRTEIEDHKAEVEKEGQKYELKVAGELENARELSRITTELKAVTDEANRLESIPETPVEKATNWVRRKRGKFAVTQHSSKLAELRAERHNLETDSRFIHPARATMEREKDRLEDVREREAKIIQKLENLLG